MYKSTFQGVDFIEGQPEGCQIIKAINTEIDGFFISAQMKSLDNIKLSMAQECKKHGGNAIIRFEYGQQSRGFFASLLSRDDIRWHAKGLIAKTKPLAE